MTTISRQRGFTLAEVLTSVTILGVLVGLLLPAVARARESARAVACRNNARQIAMALHAISCHTRSFPANQPIPWTVETVRAIDPTLLPPPSVADRDRAWDLMPAAWSSVPTLLCPSDTGAPAEQRAIANHALNHALAGLRVAAVSDGLSRTLLTGEIASANAAPWTWGPLADEVNIGSAHPISVHLSFADGSTRGMDKTVEPSILRGLLRPDDGSGQERD